MSLEYKVFAVNSAESGDEGHGYVKGYGNTVNSVDRYGDIVTEYVGLDKLLSDGFVTDTHGLTEGEMGDYTYKGQYGTIGEAQVDSKGLLVRLDFYKDEAAQQLRSRIQDRIDRGKNVYLSIGWKPAENPIFIYPSEYKTLLPKYIPTDRVQEAIDKANEYKVARIRLIKAVVSEIAFAPKPVNTESAVTTFKNEMKPVTFDTDNFKAEYLGEEIEDRLSLGAIDTLYYMMRNALYSCMIPSWGEGDDSENEDQETLDCQGIIDEFCTIAKGVIGKMQELEMENAGMEESAVAEEKSFREQGVIQFKAQWSSSYIDSLPDSSFAYIEKGGKKDSDGKTTPRSLRHFPYKDKNGKLDAAHVRNALARIPQSKVSESAKQSALKKVQAAAKQLKIGGEKSFVDIYSQFKALAEEFKAGAKHSKATKEQIAKVQSLHEEMMGMNADMADKVQEAYDCMKDMTGDSEEEKAELELLALEYEREEIFSN